MTVDRLLSEANPVATPPPGQVTPAQERVLSSIVAVPRRRLGAGAVRFLVAAPAVAAVALALVLIVGRGEGVNDEVSVTQRGSVAIGDARLVHVVTRLYGTEYGPGLGERLDGWLEPSTGRVRIVITTGGKMTLEQVADGEGNVQTWQGALGNADGLSQNVVAPDFAAELRAQVRDRMSALVESATVGFRADKTTVGAPTTRAGEYRGRAVTIHRIAPTIDGGKPSGFYFKWYTERGTDAIIAFERGQVGADGRDTVEQAEELEKLETFAAANAPLHELDWKQPPRAHRVATPPPTPTGSAGTPAPRRRQRPTPTPTPVATPTPTPGPPGR